MSEERRKLGDSALEVPRLTLGTWAFAGDAIWGEQDLKESVATIHTAIERGLNFFDTAPGYGAGRSEEVLGLAVKGRRAEAMIATKVSRQDLTAEGIKESCEASLKRMQTDYIDLLQVHWPNHEVPFPETVEAFSKLKEAGKVRAIGVCNFGKPDMEDWLEAGGEMVSNQLCYSLLMRAIEYDVQPMCKARGILVLPYSPLMQGLLTGKFRTAEEVPESRARSRHFRADRPQSRHGERGCEAETFAAINRIRAIAEREAIPMGQMALAWLLGKAEVGSVIVGARNVAQLEDNLAALDSVVATGVMEELEQATDEVKRILGNNPDLWQVPSRIRYAREEG